MTAPFSTISGQRLESCRVHVPPVGPWWAECVLEEAPDLSGTVTIKLGALSLTGTVDPTQNGVFGLQRRCRVLAGGGGWASLLPAKAYHNDGKVKALLVAEDAARLAGETLGTFSPGSDTLGVYYTRNAVAASRTLEDAAGGSPWWVDYDGTTQVGDRGTSTPSENAYQVLEAEPDDQVVLLAVDDLTAIGIGSILSTDLPAPLTVRELEMRVEADSVRVRAWCGSSGAYRSRLEVALRAIVGQVLSERLWGVYRYRLVQVAADGERLELQAVSAALGIPDVLPIDMWPGVAGAFATPTGGTEVLVAFVAGDRTQPIVIGFAPKAGPAFTPVSLLFDATSTITLGDGATQAVALKSDLQALYTALTTAATNSTPDGGSLYKTNVKASLDAALFPVCAQKVKAL